MKHNMFRKLGLIPLLAIPLVVGAGCDTVKDLKEGADDLCCKDFKIGADLSAVDWKIEGDGKAEFSAFMQASGDFAASASGLVLELSTLCQSVAVDMGVDEKKVQETDPGTRAAAWCGEVVAKLKAAGSISIDAQPPTCSLSASASASCQAKCSGKAECELQPGELPNCEGAEISGSCEGSCSGKCEGSADLAVTCEGECSGSCEGSCEGTCEGGLSGSCTGDCSGTCNGKGDGAGGKFVGKCDGTCEGTCAVTAPSVKCNGSCNGKCSGSCKAQASGSVKCDGKCDGDFEPLKCEGGKLEGGCKVEAKCDANCDASVSAKAECTPPSIEVAFSGAANVEAAGKIVATFKANLGIILSFKSRLTVMGTLAGTITGNASVITDIKAACIPQVVAAGADAVGNVSASVQATGSLAGAAGAT